LALKVGIFGTFYPEYNFAGNSTPPLAIGLAQLDSVDRVTVFCQEGATLPPYVPRADAAKVELRPCWRHGDAISLVRAARRALRSASELDVVLFNTYVTAYGRSNVANAVGLLLPSSFARLSGCPTVVYMHNFVETQEIEKLGYSPSAVTRMGVRSLERLILESTTVLVPLPCQADLVESRLGTRPRDHMFPFLESYLVAKSTGDGAGGDRPPRDSNGPRVLLMGTWGPQKDLAGALSALDQLARAGRPFTVTIAGGENNHFPGFLSGWDFGTVPSLGGRIERTGALSDVELFRLVREGDVLVLPYHTPGGYSGAMNFAAITGIPIIAYDHLQFREQARLLDTDITFVAPSGLAEALGAILDRAPGDRGAPSRAIARGVQRAEADMASFGELLRAESRRRPVPS